VTPNFTSADFTRLLTRQPRAPTLSATGGGRLGPVTWRPVTLQRTPRKWAWPDLVFLGQWPFLSLVQFRRSRLFPGNGGMGPGRSFSRVLTTVSRGPGAELSRPGPEIRHLHACARSGRSSTYQRANQNGVVLSVRREQIFVSLVVYVTEWVVKPISRHRSWQSVLLARRTVVRFRCVPAVGTYRQQTASATSSTRVRGDCIHSSLNRYV